MLTAWREAKGWFSKQEQLILRLTEEITLIADHGLSDQTCDEAVKPNIGIREIINKPFLNRIS